MRRTALAEGIATLDTKPVLHGDNGSTLKATTVLLMLNWLGVKPSYSRPRVSDDNAYAESLFRTPKYRPEFPTKGFASLDEATVMNAFGIQYGQTSGTMQAHVEGSMLLGLQVGFNGRAGLTSVDLAMAGMTGPQDILTGPYGYYTLFETEHDIAHWWPQLGQQWHITELSHKPFPSGRLTHAAVDAVQQAVAALNFGPNDLKTMSSLGGKNYQ